MTKPAIIVSTLFFNYPTAISKTPQDIGTEIITNFFDENGQEIGQAKTNNNLTKYTTEYFDRNNNILGQSESEWKGSFIRTKYFVGETLVGTSKTFWGAGLHIEHMTNYFDLDHNVVSFSRTRKDIAKSESTYNLPIPTEPAMLTEYTKAPPEFFISPLLEEAQEEANNKSNYSQSSPTMHRAKPTTPNQTNEKNEVEEPKKAGKCLVM